MIAALQLCLLLAPPREPATPRDEFAPVEIVPVEPGADVPLPAPTPAPQPEPEPEPIAEAEPIEEEPAPIEDEDIPLDDDIVEDPEAETVHQIVVDASVLGRSRPIDVFTHAGGRTLINKNQSRALGATNVGEVVARAPGVRSVEGNSGLGSQDTKLNVAVRGVNPRLSGRATVLLDEIPIAPAPYGQPQLSLFPLSLFSISEVDVVRGGATARYGPQTSGGVFNLISNPIPKTPAIAVFGQGDSNGDLSFGTSYGATHGRFGMYLEYAPRTGHSWREHSRKEIHGGIAKFAFRFNNRLELSSLSHGYYEDSELPGGLFRADYDENPFQNSRPFDAFRGSRLGTSLKLDWQPKDNLDVDFAGWYSHSYRVTAMASNPTDTRSEIDEFETSPRTYDVIGFEPRLAMRWDHTKLSHQLSVGARAAYELANIEKYIDDVGGRLKTQDGDARSAAYAAYVDEKLMFLDGDLVLDVGMRLEYIQMSFRDNLLSRMLRRNFWAPLPAASLWYSPVDEVALFLAYGRSFGPPQYLQLNAAPSNKLLLPETSNSLELGLKVLELAGIYGESTLWYKDFRNFLDVGEESYDLIQTIYLYGVESEIEWIPSEVWDMPGELSVYGGYGWTGSYLNGSAIKGHIMPWYPVHEAWWGGSYEFEFGTSLGCDVEYFSDQYTDYQNREEETIDGAYGVIPSYATVNVWTRTQTALPNGWRVEFGGGIKNVGDVRYFSRTDDRNAGIIVGRPRTYYISFGLAHDFLPKDVRESRKRREKATRTTRRDPGFFDPRMRT